MFGADIEAAARSHALAAFPNESCGVVAGGAYHAIDNISETPATDFAMAHSTWIDFKVEAVIHSHPKRLSAVPSANDMRHQIASGIPWGIICTDGEAASSPVWWGDFRLDEPLLGRQFIPGVTDCYSAIRAWRWQTFKIKLPDFPRDMQWWDRGEDLYNDGFSKAGYRPIAQSEARCGDVALINFRSKVPNHGGTLVEDGLFYHHLQNRLSGREPVGRWQAMISKWLRYEG